MHAVVSALILCSFVVLLLAGLASVLRDLLSRGLRPMSARPPDAVSVPRSRLA